VTAAARAAAVTLRREALKGPDFAAVVVTLRRVAPKRVHFTPANFR
jgi:hypothetical protein